MIVQLFIYSADDGTPLSGLSPTFAYFKRRNSDATITNLTDPPITESADGAGLYEFEIEDEDITAGSTINYVLDGSALASPRYIEDHIDADAVAAEEAEQVGDGVLTFGVTAATVRRHCFPRLNDWSTSSSPTSTTVTEKIEVASARMAAALSKESIEPVSILTETPAYAICADIIRKMVAVDLRIPADDPETVKGWQEDIKAFFAQLDEDAGIALADSALTSSDSQPNGPTTHISEYDLEIDAESDMSDATFPLHAKDSL